MRFLLAFALALAPLHAQDRLALFTGYTYQHGLPTGNHVSLNGWTAALTWRPMPRLGIAALATGGYGSSSALIGVISNPFLGSVAPASAASINRAKLPVRRYSILFGPDFRIFRKSCVTLGATAAAGVDHSSLDAPFIFDFASAPAFILRNLPSRTGPALSAALRTDLRLTRCLSYRPVEATYLAAHHDGIWRSTIQLSTGILWNLR